MIIRKVIRKISEHRISKFIIILEQDLRNRKRSKIKTKKFMNLVVQSSIATI